MDLYETHKPKIKIKIRSDHIIPTSMTVKNNNRKKKEAELISPFTIRHKSNFSVVKTSLKSILINYEQMFPIINQLVIDCHEIIARTYKLIRLYFLHKYVTKIDPSQTNNLFPPLDKSHLSSFIRVGGKHDSHGRKPNNTEFDQEINEFYDKEFAPCLSKEKYDLTRKSYIIPYLVVQMQTSFHNNIVEHFISRIRRLMNIVKPIDLNNKKLFNKIKNLILLDKHESIPEEYRIWSQMIKDQFLPKEYEKCYGYDVKIHPEKYIYYMIKMNEMIERVNSEIEIKFKNGLLTEREKKEQLNHLFQPLPLRTSKIPCYVTLDANSIISYFYQNKKAFLRKKLSSNRDAIWGSLFKTHKKVMKKKGYHFETLQTDGVGVSICFQKNDLSYAEKKKKKQPYELKHLEDLDDQEIDVCLKRKLVSGDPGKQSAIFMMDDMKNKLRYTPRQRRSESQSYVCRMIMESEKEYHGIKQEEAILSLYNSKTIDYLSFKQYIHMESRFEVATEHFYHQAIWRKMKWQKWINTRKSEDRFLNKIEETYGKREDILICYGDWSETRQMKYLMPSQGVGLRRLINKKYDVVMVDEYRTSKLCNQCHEKLVPHKNLYRVLVCQHCQNDRLESRNHFFNRDANACMNMLYLSHEWLNNKRRPERYNRSTTVTT